MLLVLANQGPRARRCPSVSCPLAQCTCKPRRCRVALPVAARPSLRRRARPRPRARRDKPSSKTAPGKTAPGKDGSVAVARQSARDLVQHAVGRRGRAPQLAFPLGRHARRQVTGPTLTMLRLALGSQTKSLLGTFVGFHLGHNIFHNHADNRLVRETPEYSRTGPRSEGGCGA